MRSQVGLPLSIFLALSGLCGCKEDSAPFLPLERLCPAIAEDICDAQGHCDCGEVHEHCRERAELRCEEAREQFTQESGLTYDGQKANAYRDELVAAVQECEPPLALGGFFEGTLETGEPCERDTQCVSLSCTGDPARCAASAEAPVCEWDDM